MTFEFTYWDYDFKDLVSVVDPDEIVATLTGERSYKVDGPIGFIGAKARHRPSSHRRHLLGLAFEGAAVFPTSPPVAVRHPIPNWGIPIRSAIARARTPSRSQPFS